jgi:radical SAM superfamily enzyme YgiQ (UPF0313 family)
MRLTLIHPCIGRRRGQDYIRTWQMEPLAPAVLAGMTPPGVDVRFYDDRMETIPFDEPTDMVALSVETYTARRVYQIASEYRRRGVKVVMGGFHATLLPGEVAEFADAVVLGEAESVWLELLDDFQAGRLKKIYKSGGRPDLKGMKPDRRIFRGKRYLPVRLVEAGRGCHFKCDFCAVTSVYSASQTRRPVDEILSELRSLNGDGNLIFFVDDNITSNMAEAKAFFRALAPLKLRWVSQASINAAFDEEFLTLIAASGCQGVLIGFESLNPANLKDMNKGFNLMGGGFRQALKNLRRHHIRLYSTFVFGYDHDDEDSFRETTEFAREQAFYIAAFNHLTPFPGTPLYERLKKEGRLLYDAWWLDPTYSYNRIPFAPKKLTAERLQQLCVKARSDFYGWGSMLRRFADPVNRKGAFMARNFLPINMMFKAEVSQRDYYPLGDETWRGELIKA